MKGCESRAEICCNGAQSEGVSQSSAYEGKNGQHQSLEDLHDQRLGAEDGVYDPDQVWLRRRPVGGVEIADPETHAVRNRCADLVVVQLVIKPCLVTSSENQGKTQQCPCNRQKPKPAIAAQHGYWPGQRGSGLFFREHVSHLSDRATSALSIAGSNER